MRAANLASGQGQSGNPGGLPPSTIPGNRENLMRAKLKNALLYIKAAMRWLVLIFIVFVWGLWYDWKCRHEKYNWWDK